MMTKQTATLFNNATQFVKKLLASSASDAQSGDLMQLFLMSRGADSVRPAVSHKLDRMAGRSAD
jgi:hypothetical protein